jgi:hypothetical protein
MARGEASWRKPWPEVETRSGSCGAAQRGERGNFWNERRGKKERPRDAVETRGTGGETGGGGGGIPGEMAMAHRKPLDG